MALLIAPEAAAAAEEAAPEAAGTLMLTPAALQILETAGMMARQHQQTATDRRRLSKLELTSSIRRAALLRSTRSQRALDGVLASCALALDVSDLAAGAGDGSNETWDLSSRLEENF